MDVIISSNDEIKNMIKDIPLGEDKKIEPNKFMEMVYALANGKGKDEVQKV